MRSVFAAHQDEIDSLREGWQLAADSPLREWLRQASPNYQEAALVLLPEQASREADELLSKARARLQHESADHQWSLEESRRTIAKLLCETEEVQSAAKKILEEAHRAAGVLVRDAEQQAQSIVGDAQTWTAHCRAAAGQQAVEATRARSRVRDSDAAFDEVCAGSWQLLLFAAHKAWDRAGFRLPEHVVIESACEVQSLQPMWASGMRSDVAAVVNRSRSDGGSIP
ncbi:hypothetical protein [Streptomyces nodosus]|uniref:Uncharacterized protein n=1 Tax=Streptomyces nodosus TaxID=40318 RepID=A0A0B5DW90_9ACTN|nr:hypothetical protein [Streptomyces nodosus]AJE44497.1 hypothetical protein SNOD_34390 [Streptomyces nodosus]MBB4796167.1 cell division septum initiation protein DivIVA [Streptomyces nodosus]